MSVINFDIAFEQLTGNRPFPWQRDLYETWFSKGKFPDACTLPTGLGKTSVVAIWLIALANLPDKLPRRLVYVVNRRTVVDQTTNEVEKLRANLQKLDTTLDTLALSTLRGQFADNREWSADPSRPAVIVGTVDMIGSRLLFSGYGVGFKAKPLHAGFLGQDVLLVHDEAHLEPAFQKLLIAIEREQHARDAEDKPIPGRVPDFRPLKVMELTATPRGDKAPFELTTEEKAGEVPVVRDRLFAKKGIKLVASERAKVSAEVGRLALRHKDVGKAVLIFVRTIDDVNTVRSTLTQKNAGVKAEQVQVLTGTLRGLERDQLATLDPVFARFLPEPMVEPMKGTVYLVCTSAGEVGVDISADHMVCDLTPLDSMAQRFGRVNRFGDRDDTRIDVVYAKEFDDNDLDTRRKRTLDLLEQLNGDGSPVALGVLDPEARVAAFAPPPTILPTSDILFDAWALTTIRGKLPGRPMVEPYLHGISGWEPPETHVAWREEVGVITGGLLDEYKPQDLLEDYPLKPHELLRDNSARVFDRLKKLAAPAETPVWVVSDDDTVEVTTLGELRQAEKDDLYYKTVLLPPSAGGLKNGMLASDSESADDVADEWFEDSERKVPRRRRVRSDDPKPTGLSGMRLIREIDTRPNAEDEEADDDQADESLEINKGRYWRWYVRPRSADDDGSKTDLDPVTWNDHTRQVTENATRIAAALGLSADLRRAIELAARFHDFGKRREVWQRSIGNPRPKTWYAKSGKDPETGKLWRPLEITRYRHEFGSLVDVLAGDAPDTEHPHLAEYQRLSADMQDVVLHLIAVHHGYGRPHFLADRAFDPEPKRQKVDEISTAVTQRFARLQRRYGRWGLAYLESLLRAADYAASAKPSRFVEDEA